VLPIQLDRGEAVQHRQRRRRPAPV
jgi:hypothetical protein